MIDLLIPGVFYVVLTIIVICLYRNGGMRKLCTHFSALKYYIGTVIYFFFNLNIMFYCLCCKECNTFCLAFALSAVLIGLVVYLTHLLKQTVTAVKNLFSEGEFEFMAPFFSIPYFVLMYDIFEAIGNSSLAALSINETKMITVMLYPFFVVLAELMAKIKEIDAAPGENTGNNSAPA